MDEKIVVKVVADTSDFKKGISEIEQQTTNATKSTQNGVSNVSSNVQGAVNSIKGSIRSIFGIGTVALNATRKSLSKLNDVSNKAAAEAGIFAKANTKEYAKQGQHLKRNYESLKKHLIALNEQKIKLLEQKKDQKPTGGSAGLDGTLKGTSIDEQIAQLEARIRRLQHQLNKTKDILDNFGFNSDSVENAGNSYKKFKDIIKDTSAYKKASSVWDNLKAKIKDTSAYKKASSAWDNLKSNFKGIKEKLSGIIKNIAKIIAGVAVLTALLVKMAKQVAQLGDEIDKGSQRLNMTVEQYQKWSYAMDLCGSSIEELRSAYGIFARQVGYAANGTKASVQAFQNLGISIYDVNGNLRSTGDIFEDTIVKLQQIENATERQAQAQQLFGRSTASLNPLLNSENGFLEQVLNTQKLLGAQMSQTMVSQSAAYTDAVATMRQAWQGFKNTVGGAVIPVLQRVVIWLTVAVAKIRMFISAFFGLDNDVDSFTESMNTASASVGGYSGALNKAAAAAKELKRQTMGFDELNIMQGPDSGSGSSSDTGLDDYDMDFGGGGVSSGFLQSEDWQKAMDDLDKFHDKVDKIASKAAGWVTALTLLGGVLAFVVGLLTFNFPLALAGAALIGIGIKIGKSTGTFDKWIKDITDGLNKLKKEVKTWWNDNVKPITTQAWWNKNFWLPIAKFLLSLPLVSTIVTAVGHVVIWYREKVKPIFQKGWFKEHWWKPLGAWCDETKTNLGTKASNAWESIKKPFKDVANWFKDIFSTAWKKVKDVFNSDGKVFDGIKEGISNTFKTVVNWLISGINAIIAIPFNKINNMLNMIKLASFLGIAPFKNKWPWNPLPVPQIPKLAKGGVVTQSTLVNIGEAGKEAVLPLDNNTGWMDMLADRIGARNKTPTKIVLAIDGKEFGYAAIDNINNITTQTGALQLKFA